MHVKAATRAEPGRDLGGHQHGRDIARTQQLRRNDDVKPPQQVGHGLHGVLCVAAGVGNVTRASKAGDEAIPNEPKRDALVVHHKVAHRGALGGGGERCPQCRGGEEPPQGAGQQWSPHGQNNPRSLLMMPFFGLPRPFGAA